MNSLIQEYYIKGIIGKGTFSFVKLGIDRITGEKVAIKILEKNKMINNKDLERVKREINILTNINHVNLIKINNIKEDLENFYIIMEFCEKGELFNYIVRRGKLDENESAFFYFQIINGLEYIHSKNIAHRDLKPENLLICKNNILKIIDFGLSNFNKNDELLSTPCGSPCYASPEMIGGKKYDGNLIDIWSSGIILYVMLCGNLPFEGQTNEILFQNIMKCKVKYPKHLSIFAVDLLQKILVPDPEQRIKLYEIKNHPFYFIGRDIFKKIHPTILEEIEKNIKYRNVTIKYNENKQFSYNHFINKTEGNEIMKYNRRKNVRSMNLDNIINNKIFLNEKEAIFNTNDTHEKSMNYHFKKINNISNESNYNNNNNHLFKLKNDNKKFENYFFGHNARALTEVDSNNLNDKKIKDYSKIQNILLGKDLKKMLNTVSVKDTPNTSTNYRKINSPSKKKYNFHSIDIGHSNNIFNFSKIKNDNKYYEFNKNKKNNLLEIIRINSKFINPLEKEKNIQRINENYTPDKNNIKKIKSYKMNNKYTNNSNNNTQNQTNNIEKYNFDESNKNNYISTKRKKMNTVELTSLSLLKNNNTINNNEKNVKIRHISDFSYNNSIAHKIINDINKKKKKKERKDLINIKDNKFMKYFKMYTGQDPIKGKKEINSYKFKKNLLINSLNYDNNKCNINENMSNNYNKENDKNYNNYNRPSVTINNMNYNLNLYEPKIYVSTLNDENLQMNDNDLVFPKNENFRSNKESFKKYTDRKNQQSCNNTMKETDKFNNNNSKKVDYFINSNFMTQYNSIDNNSINKNLYRDKKDNFSNKKFEKYKTYIETNNKCKLEDINEKINQKKTMKEVNINRNNKEDNKERIIKKINYEKIKSLKKLNLDSLHMLRNKKIEKNKLELEQQRQKVFSPSLIIPNNTFIGNKTVAKDFLN